MTTAYRFVTKFHNMAEHRTMTSALEKLQRDGYVDNLIIKNGKLIDAQSKAEYPIETFTVDKIYRFDGMTNPSDESILYALSFQARKGLFVEAFGVYDQPENEKIQKRFIEELKNNKDNNLYSR